MPSHAVHIATGGFCEQADAIFRLDDANFVLKNGGLENFVTISRPPKQQAQEGVRKMKANCLSVCGPPFCASVQGCFSQDFKRNSKIEQAKLCTGPKCHVPPSKQNTCIPQNKNTTPAHPTVGTELPLLASAVENCCRNQHWNATSPAKSTEGGNWQRSTMPRFRRTWLHMARGYVQVQRVSERPRALSSEMHPVHEAGSQS